jgi:putative LysE/RhtB family amino acid efflux pump
VFAAMNAVIIGFGLGFFVALQLGPMSLFLIRSTLRSGWRVGLAIGAGIAAVDGLYAGAGAGGATPLLTIHPVRLALGLVGAIVLVWLGTRTLYSALRVRLGGETPFEASTPRRAFLTALGGTASNPSTIVAWAAIFAAASTAGLVHTTGAAVLLVAGVAIGSLTWVSLLATGVALVGRSMSRRAVRVTDGVAGVGLIGFGGVLAFTTLVAPAGIEPAHKV